MPRVSVIVPNYNHARFLTERIESVLAQTFADFELILLDDASSDDSRSILERYRRHPRVRLHFNEVNSGSPFAQWNRGFELARGEYIWIAESDDAAEPQLLEGLLAIMDPDPGIALAYCASQAVDPEGRNLGRLPDPTRDSLHARFRHAFTRPGVEELRDQLLGVCNDIPNASGVLFRRTAIAAAGQPDPWYRITGDWEFYSRVLLEGAVAYTPEAWNRFRCHDQSARETQRRSGRRWLEVSRFYDWALRQPRLAEGRRAELIRRFVHHLAGEMQYHRAAVDTRTTLGVLREIWLCHPWIRRALAMEIARRGWRRLLSPRG